MACVQLLQLAEDLPVNRYICLSAYLYLHFPRCLVNRGVQGVQQYLDKTIFYGMHTGEPLNGMGRNGRQSFCTFDIDFYHISMYYQLESKFSKEILKTS